jgi:hypothetical protein
MAIWKVADEILIADHGSALSQSQHLIASGHEINDF